MYALHFHHIYCNNASVDLNKKGKQWFSATVHDQLIDLLTVSFIWPCVTWAAESYQSFICQIHVLYQRHAHAVKMGNYNYLYRNWTFSLVFDILTKGVKYCCFIQTIKVTKVGPQKIVFFIIMQNCQCFV